MKTAIVIARHSENVDWVSHIINKFDDVIVYNKGVDDLSIANITKINIPNIGRESQTYVQFIIDHYYNLPDYVLFCQAHPFIHGWDNEVSPFLSDIDLMLNKIPDIYLLGNLHIETCENSLVDYIPVGHTVDLRYKDEYEQLFDKKYPRQLLFSAGATLWVSKKNILNRSLEFYNTLNRKHNNEIHPAFSWVVERFWPTIFSNLVETNSMIL